MCRTPGGRLFYIVLFENKMQNEIEIRTIVSFREFPVIQKIQSRKNVTSLSEKREKTLPPHRSTRPRYVSWRFVAFHRSLAKVLIGPF